MGRLRCAVVGCFSKNPSPQSFYRINANNRDQAAWKTFCRNPTLPQNAVICSAHFVSSDFKNPENPSQGLRANANPSQFPPTAKDQSSDDPEHVPMDVDQDVDEDAHHEEDMTSHELDVGAEVELGPASENDVPLTNKSSRGTQQTSFQNDHDYCADIDRITYCMERLVNIEKENEVTKKKLRSKQVQIAKLKAKVRHLQEESRKLKQQLDSEAVFDDPILAELHSNKKRKLGGARYSVRMRNMAIILHYCSAKAYRQMRKYFTLPSISTIKHWLSKLEIKEGYSDTILELLKFRAVGLPEDEKLVSIFIDEMCVSEKLTYCAHAKPDYFMGFPTKVGKEHVDTTKRAKYALTVMVKSIKSGFKQAIGYFFNPSSVKSERIQQIVKQGISLVSRAGLIPKMLVCDQNSTNRSLFTSLGVNEDKPYFVFKKQKIFCAYDAPHLIKSARNNLLKHNAVFDGKVCSFQHIIDLYHEDSQCFPRIVPNLMYKHIDMATYAEMNVSLAAQTLSTSVYAGIKTYVEIGKLPKDCMNTAKYAKNFDKLFDCANSSTFNEANELKRPLKENSSHWETFSHMKQQLKKLRFISNQCFDLTEESAFPKLPSHSARPYFINGWLLYIAAVEGLWEELRTKYGFSFLRTRNLSQDCLEHFFSIIRWKNCNNNHPDPSKFSSAFKAVAINQLMVPKKLGNVQADLDKYFVSTQDMKNAKLNAICVAPKPTKKAERPSTNNVNMKPNQSNSVFYTTGWIAAKLKHAKCAERAYGDVGSVQQEDSILFSLKKFKTSSRFKAPGLGIFKFCKRITTLFEQKFDLFLKQSTRSVKQRLLNLLFWPFKSSHGTQTETEEPLVYNTVCVPCAEMVANKYINMLIKAKLQSLNEESKKKEQQKRKDNKNRKVQQKRKKLNIKS